MGDLGRFLLGILVVGSIFGVLVLLSAFAIDALRWTYYGWAILVTVGSVFAIVGLFRK